MTPASATARPASESSERMRFMRRVERISALPSSGGVAPPTIDVLPPCGTRATPCASRARGTIAATSAVVAGCSSSRRAPGPAAAPVGQPRCDVAAIGDDRAPEAFGEGGVKCGLVVMCACGQAGPSPLAACAPARAAIRGSGDVGMRTGMANACLLFKPANGQEAAWRCKHDPAGRSARGQWRHWPQRRAAVAPACRPQAVQER